MSTPHQSTTSLYGTPWCTKDIHTFVLLPNSWLAPSLRRPLFRVNEHCKWQGNVRSGPLPLPGNVRPVRPGLVGAVLLLPTHISPSDIWLHQRQGDSVSRIQKRRDSDAIVMARTCRRLFTSRKDDCLNSYGTFYHLHTSILEHLFTFLTLLHVVEKQQNLTRITDIRRIYFCP